MPKGKFLAFFCDFNQTACVMYRRYILSLLATVMSLYRQFMSLLGQITL